MLIKKPLTIFIGKKWTDFSDVVIEVIHTWAKKKVTSGYLDSNYSYTRLAKYIVDTNPAILINPDNIFITGDDGHEYVNDIHVTIVGYDEDLLKKIDFHIDGIPDLKNFYNMLKIKRGI